MVRPFTRWRRLAAIVCACGLNGCAFNVGGGDNHLVREETLGKRLLDLKSAKDQGAVSDEEYQKSRERILKEFREND